MKLGNGYKGDTTVSMGPDDTCSDMIANENVTGVYEVTVAEVQSAAWVINASAKRVPKDPTDRHI